MDVGRAEARGFHALAHYITPALPAGYLLSISLPLRGLKEISKSPPAELRIPSPIHSGAAGRPGINQRGNAVNSCAFFLSPAQLVAGTLPDESGAVGIHQPGSSGCIPADGLASAGSSGAASLCQEESKFKRASLFQLSLWFSESPNSLRQN